MAPWTVETRGGGHLEQFRAGPVLLGEVPFRWATEPGVVVISGVEATLFGGRLSAEARVPTSPGGQAEGTITLTGIDTAGLSAAMPGADLNLSGRADGRIRFAIPTARSAVADLVADVRLSAPDLTIRGVPARGARGSISVRGGVLAYDVLGDGLGGSVRFQGDLSRSGGPGAAPSHAKLQGSWFRLSDLWSSLGVTGPLTRLQGICGIAADLQSLQDASLRRGQAVGELRDLRWGEAPLGHLRGLAAIEPTSWRVRPLTGELLGGTVRGDLWRAADGPGPPRMGFDVQVERFHLARAVACLPGRREEEPIQGYGSVHLEGGLERAHGEVRIAQARVADLPLSELRVPLEWLFAPGSGLGTLLIRQWSARLAGGLIRGNAQVHLGAYQDYRGDLELSNVDLRAFSPISTDARRPPTGRISGRVRLDSPAPGGVRGIRGKVHLEVSDASLFELPVFRQINQFLGSEQGGIFEAGEVDLLVADRKVKIDRLALVGRLIQLRARGTIGFDARLDLEVIVRPNRVAPQTGRALASTMLGLSGARRRNEENVLRTTNRVSNGPVELRISGTVGEPTVVVDPSIDFGDD